MATLLTAGLPLLKSLSLLFEQEREPHFKKILRLLILSLEDGNSLSSSLAAHPKMFHQLSIGMIQAGEHVGMLGLVFERLALFEEKREKMERKLLSIALYPMVVLIMTFCIMGLLITLIIPKFEPIFTELLHGEALPPATAVLLGFSHAVTQHGTWLLAGTVFFFSLGAICFQKKRGQRFLLMIPWLGALLQKNELARLLGTLGLLLENKVPLLQAMLIAQQMTTNKALYHAMNTISHSLEEGDPMALPMQAISLFPAMTTSMIAVGEETGQLPAMLLKTAAIYEEEVDHDVARLVALSEPLLLLFLALLVGSIVIALFLPLVSTLSGIG